ncbi:ABC transporter permease [Streptomyces sp. NBC_00564]|uniref:ABC transporter permease n=1 Tax=Streptomyces sp. NBC_00564 TaxID=2903663 RepID=UPI00352E314B|nr:ABC transporter permease [Streptomyces sp. NBC_00564]
MTAVLPFTTTRVMLRLHRPALYVWAGVFLVAGALLLWLYGPLTDAAVSGWRQWNACSKPVCAYDQDAILTYKSLMQYMSIAVNVVPLLVAAWAGASLTGREMETGTAQLAWTQSLSPARWLAVKLAVPAALVTAGTSVLVLLHNLVWSKGRGKIDNAKSWTDLLTFHANGTTTVAFALFGLAAGALAGLVLRRSLASLAVTVAATGAVWGAVSVARPYLWPSVRTVSGLTDDSPRGLGLTVDEGLLTASGARIPNPYCGSSHVAECGDLYDRLGAVSYYNDSHPFSHYWPLQLTATALVLALAAVAVLAAFRLLKRQTGGAPVVTAKEPA